MKDAMARQAGPLWWEEQWRRYAEQELLGRPLRTSRRSVSRVVVARGRINATVGADTAAPATVTIRVKPLGEREWRRALGRIAATPGAAHRLLAGQPGPELAQVLDQEGLVLFPPRGQAAPVRCTCGKPWDCRHADAALAYLAGVLAASPLLWLEVLGRERGALLAALRAALADQAVPAGARAQEAAALAPGAAPPLDPGRFWTTPVAPEAVAIRAGTAVDPAALLRLLGPLPPAAAGAVPVLVPRRDQGGDVGYWALAARPAAVVLRRYMTRIGTAAAELAGGERPPLYRLPPPVGRPVPLRERLAPEVAAAVRGAEACLGLRELAAACPTAAALPAEEAAAGVAGALANPGALPPDVVVLAGRWATTRTALLAGVSFRHVVTFDEARTGALSPDADWVRLLALAGHQPPFRVQAGPWAGTVLGPAGAGPGGLFTALQPEVGDELRLAVADAAAPVLAVTLRRREERSLGALPAASAAALRTVVDHMRALGASALSEAEAVGVLAAHGWFARDPAPDPVWLLAVAGLPLGFYWLWRERCLTVEHWRAWGQPTGGRPRGSPREWEPKVLAFAADLISQGRARKEAEALLLPVRLWCQHWGGPQDVPQHTPPLGAFLDFLWVKAPGEARRLKLDPPLLLGALERWFAFLEASRPALAGAYAAHRDACRQAGAFATRLRTLPPGGKGPEAAAWGLEGMRWLGPQRCAEL